MFFTIPIAFRCGIKRFRMLRSGASRYCNMSPCTVFVVALNHTFYCNRERGLPYEFRKKEGKIKETLVIYHTNFEKKRKKSRKRLLFTIRISIYIWKKRCALRRSFAEKRAPPPPCPVRPRPPFLKKELCNFLLT